MKKNIFKKAFAGIMAAALVMTSATFTAKTAYAEDVITRTSGNLYIHKYEYKTASDIAGQTNGTGEVLDTTKGVFAKEDVKPLANVTFTAYKVADIGQVDTATKSIVYNTVSKIRAIPAFATKATISADSDATALAVDSVHTALAANKIEQTTDASGKATFSNLPIGLYLVEETAAPDKVTSRTAPFLVSIPMTNSTGTDWLYNVHAYPKNATSLGSITLKKVSKVPGSSTTTPVAGASFRLEKETPTNVWDTVTQNTEGTAIGTAGVVTITDANEGITVESLAPAKYRFVETAAPTGNIADAVKTYEFTVKNDNTVEGTEVVSGVITATNEQPTVEKEVLKKGGTKTTDADWKDQVDYSVGDTVPFKITVAIPSTIGYLKNYMVTDTFKAGIFSNVGNFTYKFYAGTTQITDSTVLNAMAAPTLTTSGEDTTGWTLNLAADAIQTELAVKNITSIEIEYDAELTSKAETVTAGGTNLGNKNKVSLEFSNKVTSHSTPLDTDTDKSDETYTIEDEVVVYTFGLSLVKTFAGTAGSATLKASFDLWEVKTTESTDIPGTSLKGKKVGSFTTDDTGYITVTTSSLVDTNKKAVSNGTYYLVETGTAAGYNLLKEAIPVKFNKKYTKTFQKLTVKKTYDADGNVTVTSTVKTEGTETSSVLNSDDTAYAVQTVSVDNKKGFQLPVTGGKGTILFTVIGLVLMAAAVVGFFASKKRKANA